MLKQILVILAIYPVCFMIDMFDGSNWSESYSQFILMYWDVILVVIIGIALFRKNQNFKYEVFEDIRRLQFFSETNRYLDTPYVPPVMLLYLKTPPGSVYPTDYDYVNDTFYRTVVNVFRDRVYVLQEIHDFEPYARNPYLEVFGTTRLFKCLFYFIAPFAWYFFVAIGLELSMLQDWPVLTIPFALVSFQRGMYFLHAFVEYLPYKLDNTIQENDCYKPITWREAFPDREVGMTFVRAYYFEMERRQRYEMTLQGKTIPNQYPTWNNGNFAPFLYPSNQIPTWEKDFESFYELRKSEMLQGQISMKSKSMGNVISFPKN